MTAERPARSVLRSVGNALFLLASAVAVIGVVRSVGREFRDSFGRPERPAGWEPLALTRVAAPLLELHPAVVDGRDRHELRTCFEREIAAALPGGPNTFTGPDGERRAEGAVEQAGRVCWNSFSERVLAEETWVRSFAPVFAEACVLGEGQHARARCECLATQAQQAFLGPAHFARVMRAPSPDAVTAEDARKLRAAVAACDATRRAKPAR